MKKLSKEEFVIHYMNSIDSLKILKASKDSTDLIEFFSSIYDDYLMMLNKGKIDDEKIINLFCYKSNLLIETIDELINNRAYSVSDITDALKVNFNAFSWPNVKDPVGTIEDIYIRLNQRLDNKKVLSAFPGFDDFVLLKEKYNPSKEIISEIVKNITKLDFIKINQELKYYYEVLPKEKNNEKQKLIEKLEEEKHKEASYKECKLVLETELDYNKIEQEILELNAEINIYNDKLNQIEEKKTNLNKELNILTAKYQSLNSGLSKITKRKEIKDLDNDIIEIRTKIKLLEEEIEQIIQTISEKQKKIIELKQEFSYKASFIPFDDYKDKLEKAKAATKIFENYDENRSISLINEYEGKIRQIDSFLEEITVQKKNGKFLS